MEPGFKNTVHSYSIFEDEDSTVVIWANKDSKVVMKMVFTTEDFISALVKGVPLPESSSSS